MAHDALASQAVEVRVAAVEAVSRQQCAASRAALAVQHLQPQHLHCHWSKHTTLLLMRILNYGKAASRRCAATPTVGYGIIVNRRMVRQARHISTFFRCTVLHRASVHLVVDLQPATRRLVAAAGVAAGLPAAGARHSKNVAGSCPPQALQQISAAPYISTSACTLRHCHALLVEPTKIAAVS